MCLKPPGVNDKKGRLTNERSERLNTKEPLVSPIQPHETETVQNDSDFGIAALEEGETTEWFRVQSGVKQGCTMSGFLFFLSVDWVMNSEISRKTKMQLLRTIIRVVLMYGCEAWKLTKPEAMKLHAFQYKCMKRILRIR